MDNLQTILTTHMNTLFLFVFFIILHLYSDWKNERNRSEQNKRIDTLYNMHIDFLQKRGTQTFKWKD